MPLILCLLLLMQNVRQALVIVLVEGLLILFDLQIPHDPTLLTNRFLVENDLSAQGAHGWNGTLPLKLLSFHVWIW